MDSLRMAWVVLVSMASAAPAGEPNGMVLNWPDRRPIAQLFISQAHFATEKNPGGYLGKQHDLVSPEGLAEFRKALLEAADQHVRIIKDNNGQGMVVWDVCGARQGAMMYVGDPRVLPEYSPHFNRVADEYFKKFLDAGIRTGVTIRPIYVRKNTPEAVPKWGIWGYVQYVQGEFDIVKELSERIAYARKRWGCTIFYFDSNGYEYFDADGRKRRALITPEMIAELVKRNLGVLIIPEHPHAGYYAYSAPYGWMGGGYTGTPAAVRSKLPAAFSVLSPGGMEQTRIIEQWPALVAGVAGGDVMFFYGWYPSGINQTVRMICTEAAYSRQVPHMAADVGVLTEMAGSKEPAVRYHAARALGEGLATGNQPAQARLRSLAADANDPVVAKAAIRALGGSSAADANETILTLKGIRKADQIALDRQTAAVLAGVARARKDDLRLFAVQATARLGEPGLSALKVLAKDEDRLLRQAATWGIGLVGTADAREALIGLLADPADDVRNKAVEMLVRNPDPRAVEPLLKLLQTDASWQRKLWAVQALGAIGDEPAAEAIGKLLTVEIQPGYMQQRIRSAAAKALKDIKEKR